MACTHNQVIDALAADITSYLQAAYGAESRCYRHYSNTSNPPGADPTGADPATIGAGATPAVWINELRSELPEHHSYYQRIVHVQLEGLIRFNTTNVDAGHVQIQLNELEAVLDRCLNESCLAGGTTNVPYTIHVDGEATYYVGDDSGVIVYPISLEFARLANGT